ncbi:MAG: transglutaminase-like domain-containing protein [Candidatus Paceibacterota bacterium]|jgi:transglutaminase-like putative cysteine protease
MNKTQIESSDKIKALVADIVVPITSDTLKTIRDLMYSKLEIRPYDKTTEEHEKSIRWKRTASEILDNAFVYQGKACTDLAVLFIALCNALGLETRFVKIKKEKMVHSVVEIKLADGWYIFDTSDPRNNPIKGEITETTPYKDWILWKKGRDAWDLELIDFDSMKKIHG